MIQIEDSQVNNKFRRPNYVVDSNFLVDFPGLTQKDGWQGRFEWGEEPFILVVTDVVLAELDKLKHTGTEDIKFRVRKAVTTISNVLENGGKLCDFGHLKIYGNDKTQRGDSNLLERAKEYASGIPDERAVLLTSDNLLRLRCQNSGVDCISPENLEEIARKMAAIEAKRENKIKATSIDNTELSELQSREGVLRYKLNLLGMAGVTIP